MTNIGTAGTFRLGDAQVKRMGYGAMQLAGKGVFGPPKDRDAAVAVLRAAVEAGVDHIDTSDFYGPHVTNEIIREALHPYPEDLTIVTKVGAMRGANGSWKPAFSAGDLRKAVEDNLRNLGLDVSVSFTGALAFPYLYPWPQRPAGLVETAFDELARRWRPILDHAEDCGVDICYEIHPGEDLHDGVTFEMFLERVGNHARCNMLYDPSHYVLQCLDYIDNIDIYKDRIKMFHVKDAEFNPTGRQGVYSGYQSWVDRAGRFRSLGDGQVDFGAIFSKMAANDFDGWAVVEWECCLKHPEDGAREGAQFVSDHIIRVTERAFDDFADGGTDDAANRRMLGIS